MAKAAAHKKGADTSVVRLKVTLRGVKPPIWRRLVMPAAMTLRDLHDAIQAAMGWQSSHMHAFEAGGRRYGDQDMLDDVADEHRATLSGLRAARVRRFVYTYDFGDSWEHDVEMEATAPADRALSRPTVIAGKRRCPPEDCGGPWGYGHLLAVLSDPSHPEHDEQIEWVGDEDDKFDPEAFDVAKADAELAARFGGTQQR